MKKILAGDFPITQYFGENPDMYAKFGLRGHNGIDFGCPSGTDCISPIDGTATEVASDPTGYGFYVKVENDLEACLFGHFSVQGVSEGATIVKGMVIGKTGNTGNSTGPHLHFGYFTKPRDRNNGYNGYIDPLPFLEEKETKPNEVDVLRLRVAELEADGERKGKLLEDRDTEITKLKGERVTLEEKIKGLEEALVGAHNDLQGTIQSYVAQVLHLETEVADLQRSLTEIVEENNELKTAAGEYETNASKILDKYTGWGLITLGFKKMFQLKHGR